MKHLFLFSAIFFSFCPSIFALTFAELCSNMLHRRGQHSFRFDFTITNIRPGDFFIRLTTGKDVLNEMMVTF